jgi:hypothetical protein
VTDWHLWFTPIAVIAIVALFAFVGCGSFGSTEAVTPKAYKDDVKDDAPVMYLRLQEQKPATAVPGGKAKDEQGSHDGIYETAGSPLTDDPATLSPAATPILLDIGIGPALLSTDAASTAIRVRGGRVTVASSPALNPVQFSFEALVQAEWNLSALGRYYAVVESTDEPPGGSNKSKKFGYALYAGPADPTTPNTPYRWQLWFGNGTTFKQLKEQPFAPPVPPDPPNPGPLVEAKPTYLCVTHGGGDTVLYVYTLERDLDWVKYRLVPQAYAPNTTGALTLGMARRFRSLVAPFPGPAKGLYPFVGKLQEIAIYNKALTEERITSHAMNALHG